MNEVSLDLPRRRERRFIIPSSEQFLNRISPYVERKIFSDRECVETIYFNNDEHVVPFSTSLKARRYLFDFSDFPTIDDGAYFLDIKKRIGDIREKTRLETTLKQATEIANEKFPLSEIPLRPYVLVRYNRKHYVPKDSRNTRITLDSNVRFFFFPLGKREAVEIVGEEDSVRLEIKEEESDEIFDGVLNRIFREINAFPIISKQSSGYRFLSQYRVLPFGNPFHKEISGYEIESKLETDSEEVFQEVKEFFRREHSGFKLSSVFPYTLEKSSINRYYITPEGLIKILFKPNGAHIVRKGSTEIMNDKFGLNCILKREEVKEKSMSMTSLSSALASAKLQGELHRSRKAFWMDNLQTHRTYHLSFDCCFGLPGKLYEMEIEYTGRRMGFSENTSEEKVVGDIAEITKMIIDRFPQLRPSQLTKTNWLGIE